MVVMVLIIVPIPPFPTNQRQVKATPRGSEYSKRKVLAPQNHTLYGFLATATRGFSSRSRLGPMPVFGHVLSVGDVWRRALGSITWTLPETDALNRSHAQHIKPKPLDLRSTSSALQLPRYTGLLNYVFMRDFGVQAGACLQVSGVTETLITDLLLKPLTCGKHTSLSTHGQYHLPGGRP